VRKYHQLADIPSAWPWTRAQSCEKELHCNSGRQQITSSTTRSPKATSHNGQHLSVYEATQTFIPTDFRARKQWLLSPKSGIEIGCNFPSSFGLTFPPFVTPVFPSILGFFSLYRVSFVKGLDWKNRGIVKKGKSFVKSVICLVENRGKVKRGESSVMSVD